MLTKLEEAPLFLEATPCLLIAESIEEYSLILDDQVVGIGESSMNFGTDFCNN
ncbi:MAG: hypothetical protein AAGA80_22810 [Cyanobacteria bacterium P01_F01_bin.143]